MRKFARRTTIMQTITTSIRLISSHLYASDDADCRPVRQPKQVVSPVYTTSGKVYCTCCEKVVHPNSSIELGLLKSVRMQIEIGMHSLCICVCVCSVIFAEFEIHHQPPVHEWTHFICTFVGRVACQVYCNISEADAKTIIYTYTPHTCVCKFFFVHFLERNLVGSVVAIFSQLGEKPTIRPFHYLDGKHTSSRHTIHQKVSIVCVTSIRVDCLHARSKIA